MFDKDNDKKILMKILFCDFGEVFDFLSVDVIVYIIEGLVVFGYKKFYLFIVWVLEFI